MEICESKIETMIAFRLNDANERVCPKQQQQQQLDCIPYLAALIAYKDDFLSIENENGAYVLNPPICYTWFKSILHSIISEEPYVLFNELLIDNK